MDTTTPIDPPCIAQFMGALSPLNSGVQFKVSGNSNKTQLHVHWWPMANEPWSMYIPCDSDQYHIYTLHESPSNTEHTVWGISLGYNTPLYHSYSHSSYIHRVLQFSQLQSKCGFILYSHRVNFRKLKMLNPVLYLSVEILDTTTWE